MPYDDGNRQNFQYVIVKVDKQIFGKSRDQLKLHLEQHGIMARRYFYPGCHRMEPYYSLYPDAAEHLPETERFAEQVLALPTGSQITPAEVLHVGEYIREFARQ